MSEHCSRVAACCIVWTEYRTSYIRITIHRRRMMFSTSELYESTVNKRISWVCHKNPKTLTVRCIQITESTHQRRRSSLHHPVRSYVRKQAL